MAVVMLSENCACQYMDKLRNANPNQFCGCLISEDVPYLSAGLFSRIKGAVQQAAGAVGGAVQQAAGAVGGAVQQATGAIGGLVQQSAGAAGSVIQQTVQTLTPAVQTATQQAGQLIKGAVQTASDPTKCPACHRVVDNLGQTIGNLTGALPNIGKGAGNIVNATFDAAGKILTGVGTGVGTFVGDAKNIPCIANAVGAATGVPLGIGGCQPAGFNEQYGTIPPPETKSEGINPLILAGGAAAVLFLLMKKK